jgi:hypothetical protein
MAERKAELKLTEAAAKATAALQTLQSRLRQETTPLETREELGQELEHYFATLGRNAEGSATMSGSIQDQVIEKVVERILASWGDPEDRLTAIKGEVIARLAERVVAELVKPEPAR